MIKSITKLDFSTIFERFKSLLHSSRSKTGKHQAKELSFKERKLPTMRMKTARMILISDNATYYHPAMWSRRCSTALGLLKQ